MQRVETQPAYLRLGWARRLPVIRQATSSECGLVCIAMLADYLGLRADLAQLRRQFPTSLKGATLADIVAACDGLKIATRAVRCGVSDLQKLRTPCLLHWRFNHYVVLKSVHRDHVVIHDPARGRIREALAVCGDAFTGVALEVSRGRGFTNARRVQRLKLGGLVAIDGSILDTFLVGLLLALLCETFLLASPFYLQLVIDQVLGKGDHELLNTLAAAFGALLVFQCAANTLRQLTFQYLSQVTVFDMSARVMHALMARPFGWFRSRDLGDVQHRVQSMSAVQAFVIHAAPTFVLDLLFLVLICALMLAYDVALTALAVGTLGVWVLWRSLLLPLSLRRSNDIATAESLLQTHFLETLRASQTVKLLGGEPMRESEWRNLLADRTNAGIRAGNLGIADNAMRLLLFQGMRVAAVFLLARKALDGQMSIGMVSAFVAYLGMFTTRSGSIVDVVIAYRLLDVPLDRLADIVFGDTERGGGAIESDPGPPRIELRDVAFRYSTGEPAVLKHCSCSVPAGGFLAIAGCSGSGKSTLLRLISGIEPSSAGELLIAGHAARDLDARSFRRRIATVFENDVLLKGSIAENIVIFDPEPEMERLRKAAIDACIAHEIEAMPMAYETRIGDLGSALSKGQVQRVLLARALYRQPSLLLLDEATSGLDGALEKQVIHTLCSLDATRIVVTHSDRVLEAAHQVMWLSNGTLLSSRPELNV